MEAAAQVEDVVRRYFESGDRSVAGESLRAWDESIRAAGFELPTSTVIRSLTVLSVGPDEARVDLDAVASFELRTKRGRPKRVSTSIAGPVSVRRESGRWLVEDHCIDGRTIAESFVPVTGAAVAVDGLSLRLTAVRLGRRDVLAVVVAENDRSESAAIGRVLLRVKRRTCLGGKTRDRFEHGQSAVGLGWRKSLRKRGKLRVELELRGTSRHDVAWEVDLERATAEGSVRPTGQVRSLLRNPSLAWATAAVFWAALLATGTLSPLSAGVGVGVFAAMLLLPQSLQRLVQRS